MGMMLSSSLFFVLPLCLLYTYSVIKLYIGHNTHKYKLIVIILNFILLIIYIISLFTITVFTVPAIILLLLILAIIILGMIGGFMYNPSYAVDRRNELQTLHKWVTKTYKTITVVLLLIVFVFIGYQSLTHRIERLNRIVYINELISQSEYSDSELRFNSDNEASLFIFFGVSDFEDVTGIKIYIDELLIHEHTYTDALFSQELDYDFEYDFDEVLQNLSDADSIIIEVVQDGSVISYEFNVYDKLEYSESVNVWLWINE